MIYRSNQYDSLVRNDNPYYEFDGEIGLAELRRFMGSRGRTGNRVCIHELGVNGFRFDLVILNPYSRRVRILEYKVDRGDFLGDRKCLGYMGYCNTLSFVTPLGLCRPEELAHQAFGLLQVFRWRHRGGEVQPWGLGCVWLRKPIGRELSLKNYYKVADMMLTRLVQGRKDDFF